MNERMDEYMTGSGAADCINLNQRFVSTHLLRPKNPDLDGFGALVPFSLKSAALSATTGSGARSTHADPSGRIGSYRQCLFAGKS